MITTRRAGKIAAALTVPLVMGLLSAQPAPAQQAPLSVQEIRGCLCLQPQLQPLQDAWRARQQDYDEHQAQLATIDKEVTAQRQKLDPNDVVGQQVLKDLLTQQQELRDGIGSQILPALNKARDAYNTAVAQYNGTCTRPRYSGDETLARQNLVCTAPQ
ncbi:MAG TPA: hypothetical protein VMW18_18895 [Candidatus Binatia bacterium]|nr:hypothetical protein [Candidatus Binatia bacterium]